MAYTLKLGTFEKKENSTKQPNVTPWTEYSVVLKDGSDLVSPTITLAIDYSTAASYNYAYMNGRYYWVIGKNMLRSGYCSMQLDTDVLATYKSQIGDTQLYILRSSASSNGYIFDNLYPPTSEFTGHHYTIDSTSHPYSSGVYVVNVMGKNTGSSTLYEMTPSAFSSFLDKIYATYSSFTWDTIADQVTNGLFKPLENINSIMWYPEAFTNTTTVNALYIGLWSITGLSGIKIINNPVKSVSYSTYIAKHPDASTRGAYLNCAPYTETILDFPPFGLINIDSTQLQYNDNIVITLKVDALTGMATLRGEIVDSRDGTSEDYCLFNVAAQWGVSLPILQGQGGSAISTLVSAAAGIASAASGNIIGAIGATTSAIGSVANSVIGTTSTNGSQGTILAHQMPKYQYQRFFKPLKEDNTHNGRPLCEVKKPSALGGFMIAERGDVAIPGTLPEETRVKNYLETGFYYE